MNSTLLIGITLFTFTLFSYTISFISANVKSVITHNVLFYFVIGIVLDIAATIMMILGSISIPFTFHGFTGYVATLFMGIAAVQFWKDKIKNGYGSAIRKTSLFLFRIGYFLWIIVYLSGAIFAILKK